MLFIVTNSRDDRDRDRSSRSDRGNRDRRSPSPEASSSSSATNKSASKKMMIDQIMEEETKVREEKLKTMPNVYLDEQRKAMNADADTSAKDATSSATDAAKKDAILPNLDNIATATGEFLNKILTLSSVDVFFFVSFRGR